MECCVNGIANPNIEVKPFEHSACQGSGDRIPSSAFRGGVQLHLRLCDDKTEKIAQIVFGTVL